MANNSQPPSEPQRRYWNAIAADYRAITRIDGSDFHYGPLLPGERKLRLLPPLTPGMTALELGCGEGQNSLYLARLGLQCTALDISEAQLSYARADADPCTHAGTDTRADPGAHTGTYAGAHTASGTGDSL